MKAMVKITNKKMYIDIPYHKTIKAYFQAKNATQNDESHWVLNSKDKEEIFKYLLEKNVDVEIVDALAPKKRFVILRNRDERIEIYSDFDKRVNIIVTLYRIHHII